MIYKCLLYLGIINNPLIVNLINDINVRIVEITNEFLSSYCKELLFPETWRINTCLYDSFYVST